MGAPDQRVASPAAQALAAEEAEKDAPKPTPETVADVIARQRAEEAARNNGDATPPDAVVVLVMRDENGGAHTAITTQGDVRVTEVETLLRLALNGFRENSAA